MFQEIMTITQKIIFLLLITISVIAEHMEYRVSYYIYKIVFSLKRLRNKLRNKLFLISMPE